MFAATNVAAALVKRPKFSGEYIFQVMNTLHIEQLPPEWESIAHVLSALGDVTRQKIILLFEPGEEIGLKAIVDCFPLSRTASADEYEPLARFMAEKVGIEFADPTTFEAVRMMYWPSCCSASEYVFVCEDKPMLDVDGVLAAMGDWQDVSKWPQVPGAENSYRKLATRQSDPLSKAGIIGAFCRTYDVYGAMVSAPVQFCNFSPNVECKKMAGKGMQPLNNYTCRFRPSSLKCTDKSGLDGLQTDK